METSTPVGSPMRRKLSTRNNLIAIEDNQEDIESELRNRRLEAINKSTESRRRSAAAPLLAGLNSNQLAQHCKDCIKLSTENKINSKNAFNFLLIDFMAAMTKKSDSEISKNFQVASCTLDASVKIYGYRVDAVHTEAVKIAGGFIGKEIQEALDGDEGAIEEGDPDKPEGKVKPKKRKKKMNIVAPHTLNVKSESEALMDMRPSLNVLSKHADGSRLLTRVPKYNDECALVVSADTPCWPYDSEVAKESSQLGNVFDPVDLLILFRSIELTPEDKFCAAASAIEFGKDVGEDVPSELELTQTSTYEFDMNASVANVSQDEPMEEEPLKLLVPCTGYDSGEEIKLPCKPMNKVHHAALSDMKRRLSMNTMEYSMFDEKLLKAWAGPTYWKVRPSKPVGENKENEDDSKPVASKRTRRGRVKETLGLFEVDDEIMARQLEMSDKTVLAKSTLCNWKVSAITLADDYKYSPKQLLTLFHLPLYVVKPQKEVSLLEDALETNEENEGPNEELEYCSQIVEDEYPPEEGEGDLASKSVHEVEAWDADNLLAAPSKIQKLSMGSFQRKKYIDIKHLKRCIWNLLTNAARKENDDMEETAVVKDSKSFSELLKTCPSKLPGNVKGCVNAPLMFNALLHLTNEKSLVLNQGNKGGDFKISQ